MPEFIIAYFHKELQVFSENYVKNQNFFDKPMDFQARM